MHGSLVSSNNSTIASTSRIESVFSYSSTGSIDHQILLPGSCVTSDKPVNHPQLAEGLERRMPVDGPLIDDG